MPFFQELQQDSSTAARCGRLEFVGSSGAFHVETPAFMPVGTRASVKSLSQEDLEELGYKLILANTYHLRMRPGDELIQRRGGVKKFMSWSGALLTDSGGYQAFSLASKTKLQDDGIEFKSHINGDRHFFSPEGTIDIQMNLGSDIMMVLDDCAPAGSDTRRLRESLDRTHNWARRSVLHHKDLLASGEIDPARSRLFGIIQGGTDAALRRESAQYIQSLPFDGIAVGGLSVGETRESFYDTLAIVTEVLAADRPRYLMGVGTVPDLLEGVRCGIDMFDCVLPTRNARNGQFITTFGPLNIRNAMHAENDEPIDESCSCSVCRRYSKAYLRHLFISGEMLGPRLATYHNLHFIGNLMNGMRAAIRQKGFADFYRKILHDYSSGLQGSGSRQSGR